MSYVLAVDVGTSFTAAAIARFDQGASSPECLPLGLRATSVPSVLFYPDNGPVLVGEAAERRGLDSPGRVVREFKRRVGDAVPISVGTLSLAAEDVFATMARWVADRAEERQGAPPSEIILTYPAAWGFHRTSLIKGALAAKGLGNVTLLTEPEAAALHYASQVRVEDGSIIAVYDLGGGTFDTAVLRKETSNRFELLGKPEGFEHMGGADFDAALFRFVAEHTDGALARLDPAAPGVLAAVSRLRRECVEAKEALSSDSEANISVLLPGIQQQIRLVRPEFESMIEDPVRDTVDALEQSLGQLGLEPADLTAVLLIGGSSRIPLVAQLISEQLDRPIAVDADPKSSICMGAAVSAVLGRAAMAAAAAAESSPVEAPGEAVSSPAPDAAQAPLRLASWSRNPTPVPHSLAAAALSQSHGDRGGVHAPKPRVRLTAVAATAVLFTVLTATAAQSPAGFNSLTSVFVPPAGASNDRGAPSPTAAAGGGSGADAAAGAAGDVQVPVAGIDSGMERAAASQAPGPVADGKPTGQVSSIRSIEKGASEGPSASAVAAGEVTGTTAPGDPVTSDAATDTATSTGTPTTGEATPTVDPTTTDATEPGTSSPSTTESGSESGTPTPPATESSTPEPTRFSGTAAPTPTDTTATPSEPGRWLKPAKGSKSRDLTASPSPTVQVSASPASGSTSTAEESLGSGSSGTATATSTDTATTTTPAA
ncbi:Hsp70 family protein [Arthrobacter sp. OY3WO11]|uniref:Hsp70 family protein n=1 Tax=Arthrobacter sp. OY3WO11 TaxID=1835723 RepID=UPI0007CF96E4|nr:Hsp70 family protein [Arthrobacter sp. OY3WO11]OAE02871.1 molecular chaperone DnaK [Arthrobacter sp. OY3WO11]